MLGMCGKKVTLGNQQLNGLIRLNMIKNLIVMARNRLTRQQIDKEMEDDDVKLLYFIGVEKFVQRVTPEQFADLLKSEVYSPRLIEILLELQDSLVALEHYEMAIPIRDFLNLHKDDILW